MKVSCQSCGAQYNLPDEKVRGRKAKVRCKKCTAQIIVDGTAAADDDDEATRVMQAPTASVNSDPTWTVNLSDEDQLDMTEAEILAGWRDGRVTDDAYVWREGMEEWLPILESPELGAAIRALGDAKPAPAAAKNENQDFLGLTPSASSASEAAATQELAASTTSAQRATGSSPSASDANRPSVPSPKPKAQKSEDTSKAFSFALAGASSANTTKRASRPPAAAQTKGAGLFGGPQPAANPQPSLAADIGGGTSENSVMFSLDALKAAAAVEPRKTLRAAANNEARVTEDILTLGSPNRFDNAVMPLIDVEVPPPVARAESTAFAPPIAPVTQQKKSSVGIWAIGALAVVGMFGAYVLGSRGSDQPVVNNDTGPARNASSEQSVPSETSTGVEQSNAAVTASVAVSAAAPSASAQGVAASGSTPSGGGRNTGGGGGKTTEKPEAKPETTDKPAGGAKPPTTPATPPAAKPSGPAFNVAAAKAALNSAAASASGCRAPAGPSGTGKVQVTFAPSGNVTSALIISGPFGGTPVGSCVARTFRAAKVPAFDGSPMTVAKSFTIN
jgi:predicted Zn finger-like uncharacterized protein